MYRSYRGLHALGARAEGAASHRAGERELVVAGRVEYDLVGGVGFRVDPGLVPLLRGPKMSGDFLNSGIQFDNAFTSTCTHIRGIR